MITSRIARRASSSPPIAYTQPPSARYTKLLRNWSLRICFWPSSSARRLDVTGASSVSPTSTSTAASDAPSSGRITRWNEIPDAFAAVSSEWRSKPRP